MPNDVKNARIQAYYNLIIEQAKMAAIISASAIGFMFTLVDELNESSSCFINIFLIVTWIGLQFSFLLAIICLSQMVYSHSEHLKSLTKDDEGGKKHEEQISKYTKRTGISFSWGIGFLILCAGCIMLKNVM